MERKQLASVDTIKAYNASVVRLVCDALARQVPCDAIVVALTATAMQCLKHEQLSDRIEVVTVFARYVLADVFDEDAFRDSLLR